MATRKEKILSIIEDMAGDLLYDDRDDDEELPRGAIEDAVRNGEISLREMIDRFGKALTKEVATSTQALGADHE